MDVIVTNENDEEKTTEVKSSDEPMDTDNSDKLINSNVNNAVNSDIKELKDVESKTVTNDIPENEMDVDVINNISENDESNKLNDVLKDEGNNASKGDGNIISESESKIDGSDESEGNVNNNVKEDTNDASKNVINDTHEDLNHDTTDKIINVSKDQIVNDSKEEKKGEEFLPFQTLSVELKEGDEEQPMDDTTSRSVNSSENIVTSTPAPELQSDAEKPASEIHDDSAVDQSDSFPKTDEIATENISLMPDVGAMQEPATSYLEDFLFTSGSNYVHDSDSTSCDEKGLPLRKFPGICKGVENADYEVLQALYLILYLRNAWDTESILVQRILDFSGFDCDSNSEDFYTRKLNLCTMSNELLNKIKILLQVPALWPAVAASEEAKLDAVQRILAFLQKPSKNRRSRTRMSTEKRRAASRKGPRGKGRTSKAKHDLPVSNTSADLNLINTDTSFTNTSFTSQEPSESNDSTDIDKSDKVGLYSYKPGPLSFKLKASGLSESEIIEIEKSLKEKLAKGNAAQVKVILQKLDCNEVMGKEKIKELLEKELNIKHSPRKIPEKPFAQVKTTKKSSESEEDSAKNKKNKDKEIEKVVKPNDESVKKDGETHEKDTEAQEKDAEKKDEESAADNEPPPPKKKLKEFPLVLSCIEGTPDKILQEVYYLLYLERDKQDIEEVKDRILEFDGFPFDEKSEEYKKHQNVLSVMDESMVKDIARALYLDPKMDKLGTEMRLLEFLLYPKESLLRPTVIAPGMLADCDIDFEGLSDSDDSIIYEVVEKKVECVDLLSSGEEDNGGTVKSTATTPTVNKPVLSRGQSAAAHLQHQAAIAQLQAQNAAKRPEAQQPSVASPKPASSPVPSATTESTPTSSSSPTPGGVRTLRNFVTIKKIVETHPNEYLVDIYNLLYMQNCQPENLRKDILDFTGFDFDKTSPEYTKRKLFLDRMLYNSVRRIYNTLIHNTREVKVFSKPTMIGEIFQFLLQLPDHDTSIPPPRPTPVVKTYSSYANVSNIIANQGTLGKEQSGKLSDLKRVFQRVACFPCEYLVDVHKLLFMTDCEMKDIRANIFAFKGFSFAIGSPEFNQRKMFLEYLTFHSLRKISSVLTTKTVDMRNSTKHELASHLTEVLKEYTTLKLEEDIAPKPTVETQETPKPVENTVVEQIVVTPIIPSIQAATPQSSDRDVTVSSSTSTENSSSSSVSKANSKTAKAAQGTPSRKRVSSPSTDAPSSSTPTSKAQPSPRPQLAKRSSKPDKKKKVQTLVPKPSQQEQNNNMQFADINLPDIEKYRQIYKSSMNISVVPNPPATASSIPEIDLSSINAPSSTTLNFQPEFLYQPVGAPLPMMNPNMGVQLPLINSFQQQLQNSTFFVQSPSYINSAADVSIPVECVLQEGKPVNIPGPKRFKQMVSKVSADQSGEDVVFPSHIKEENENPSSSIQLKIRDAMTKTGDDEEDCDKPLATLVGHPNDKVLKQQICEIVENTDLQDISMNGVIQKIFNMYSKFDLNYRKEFIKSTLRSLLYQLGEQDAKKEQLSKISSSDVDSSVTASKRKSTSSPLQRHKS